MLNLWQLPDSPAFFRHQKTPLTEGLKCFVCKKEKKTPLVPTCLSTCTQLQINMFSRCVNPRFSQFSMEEFEPAWILSPPPNGPSPETTSQGCSHRNSTSMFRIDIISHGVPRFYELPLDLFRESRLRPVRQWLDDVARHPSCAEWMRMVASNKKASSRHSALPASLDVRS